MFQKKYFFLAGIACFFLFVIFSFFVHKGVFTHFDFNSTIRLQDHMPRRFDDFFSGLSEFGQVEPMSIVLVILIVGLLLHKKIIAGVSAGVLFVTLHLFELYGKFFVNHLPPPEFMLRTQRLVNFPQFTVRTQNSYPSGHAGRALFLSTILAVYILQSKRLSPLVKLVLCGCLVIYDGTMLASRVYLGEHWTTDVIGGSLLGLALGLVEGGLLLKKDVYVEGEKHKKNLHAKNESKQVKVGKFELRWND